MKPRDSYPTLRRQVHQTLLLGQKQIEQAKVQTYWQTGKLINDHIARAKSKDEHYGGQVIARLSRDLDIGQRVLERCAQFARTFEIPSARTESSPALSWAHYRELITVRDADTRTDLLKRAASSAWSSHELSQKIRLEARSVAEENDARPARPFPKLVPKRGTLYTYRLTQNAPGALSIDLGFQTTRAAGPAKGFEAGQIVESQKKEELYALRKSERGEKDLFTYKARIERVVDGDTLRVVTDLGFGISLRQYLRLRGIDAPELSTPEGRKAKAFVERALEKAGEIVLTSTRDDKYGRYLADVFYTEDGKETYLNQRLLDEGLAARYDGGARLAVSA